MVVVSVQTIPVGHQHTGIQAGLGKGHLKGIGRLQDNRLEGPGIDRARPHRRSCPVAFLISVMTDLPQINAFPP